MTPHQQSSQVKVWRRSRVNAERPRTSLSKIRGGYRWHRAFLRLSSCRQSSQVSNSNFAAFYGATIPVSLYGTGTNRSLVQEDAGGYTLPPLRLTSIHKSWLIRWMLDFPNDIRSHGPVRTRRCVQRASIQRAKHITTSYPAAGQER